jgi:hypothetical protein
MLSPRRAGGTCGRRAAVVAPDAPDQAEAAFEAPVDDPPEDDAPEELGVEDLLSDGFDAVDEEPVVLVEEPRESFR